MEDAPGADTSYLEEWAMLPLTPRDGSSSTGPSDAGDGDGAATASPRGRGGREGGEPHAASRAQLLEAKVRELELKLEQMHVSDVHALRRAHKTLAQHVQHAMQEEPTMAAEAELPSALSIESAHVPTLLASFETSVLTPSTIATEAGVLAGISASAWLLDRFFRYTRAQSPSKIIAFMAAAAVSWRVVRSSSRRLLLMLTNNQRVKAQLQHDWRTIAERIVIMAELAKTHGNEAALGSTPYAPS